MFNSVIKFLQWKQKEDGNLEISGLAKTRHIKLSVPVWIRKSFVHNKV